MNNPEELTGMLALVHPALSHDPAGKQNQVGMITDADLANDDIYIGFAKGEQGRYSADAVLIMKPANTIHFDLMQNRLKLEVTDFKTLMRIALLRQGHPTMADKRSAMAMAMQNETLRNNSMATVAEAYPQEMSISIGR